MILLSHFSLKYGSHSSHGGVGGGCAGTHSLVPIKHKQNKRNKQKEKKIKNSKFLARLLEICWRFATPRHLHRFQKLLICQILVHVGAGTPIEGVNILYMNISYSLYQFLTDFSKKYSAVLISSPSLFKLQSEILIRLNACTCTQRGSLDFSHHRGQCENNKFVRINYFFCD